MLRGSPQSEIDRHAYIPPEVKQSLDQHFNQAVSPHLRQYASSNNSGYISRGMEQAISKQMQKNLPSHLKAYADAYVQQSVVQPIVEGSPYHAHTPISVNRVPPPAPDKLNRSHSIPYGEQHSVELNTLPLASETLFERPEGSSTIVSPNNAASNRTATPDSPYDFIMNPSEQPPPHPPISSNIPGVPPFVTRIIVVAGGLFVLLVVFIIFKALLSSGGSRTGLTAVDQDQTEMLHILNNSAQTNAQNISSTNQNIIATMQISMTSSNQQLLSYFSTNHIKVSAKEANLKISLTTDNDLTNSQSAGDYNQVLDQVLQTDLTTYQSDLSTAYKQVGGPKGKALLSSDYNQAKLLLDQINNLTATSSS